MRAEWIVVFLVVTAGCASHQVVEPIARAPLMRVEQMTLDTSGAGLQMCSDCPERTVKVVDMHPPLITPTKPAVVSKMDVKARTTTPPVVNNTPQHPVGSSDKPKSYAVHFAFGKHDLDLAGKLELDSVIRIAKANPRLNLLVQGRTDPRGTLAFNKKLALRRGNTVAKALISAGIKKNRIEVKIFDPCCSGDIAAPEDVQQKLRAASVQITLQS